MEDRQFDLIARAQGAAGSRRQGLKLLAASVLGGLLAHVGFADAAAACRTFNKNCDNQRRCCNGIGLRCLDGRCKCRNGHARCTAGPGCQNLKRDPDHCGKCDKKCPASKPCCIKGACRSTCGDAGGCCGDCFVTIADQEDEDEPPGRNEGVCCDTVGTVCSRKPGGADDRCCNASEECLKGRCCWDGEFGEVNCAGTCCRAAACCNDNTCCKKGFVCATKTLGSSQQSCVSGNRDCAVDGDCFSNENCLAGTCCAGVRSCLSSGGDAFCCKADEYCRAPGTPVAECAKVHTGGSSTYRSYRVRP